MTQVINFGSLGKDFQLKLIAQILYDRDFGLNIITLMQPNYFENQYCKQIISIVKNYNETFDNQLPTITGLQERIIVDTKDEVQRNGCLAVLKDLHKRALEDDEQTKDLALKFCSQQELIKLSKEVLKIASSGDFENMMEIETLVRKASTIITKKDDSMEVTDDMDAALEEDYRDPLPTGVDGLDVEIGGGLAKGELGMLICPLGVGKSTLLSKFANTTYGNGGVVLQIFFEDKKVDIQRKHFSAFTNIAINDLFKHKEEVKNAVNSVKKAGGRLILKKCPSDSTTIPHIKQYIKYLRNKGIVVDMLILDYIDCIAPSRATDDGNANEGTVIRQLESLTSEYNLATWTAVQGNRSSISSDVVSTDMIQGSIKRAQVGHIIISVGKTMDQKAQGLANMAILKSRVGGDGKVFNNMTFRNDCMIFDTKESELVSVSTFENNKEEQEKQQQISKAIDALAARRERKKLQQQQEEEGVI